MSFYKGKKVLVTGAAGIAGHSAVKRLLKEGANVRAVTFNTRKLSIEHPNLEVVKYDLMEHKNCMKALEGIDICFNMVAFIRGAKGQTDEKNVLILSCAATLKPSAELLADVTELETTTFTFNFLNKF